MRTVEAFVCLTAIAHGYPPDARSASVGAGEQAAAIHLVGGMGRRDRHLRKAAVALFDDLDSWLPHTGSPASSRLIVAVKKAREDL
nr:hypothetical protein [Clavibacter michiganensis]